ncbi:hypothetical protein B0T16DRAFT_407930 [Cercophora newfieldiana]|uniref:Uncharacterized protein n=1 Tax=Cercophora newfieldiana TaxID=92897 RepID=A0AA39Y9K9_9PEZI|nr:hypothetical protein B0T16DRAFT_407930 [Cercophora newfieldiana]
MKATSFSLLAFAITLLANSPTIFGRTVSVRPRSELGLVGDGKPLEIAKRAGGGGGGRGDNPGSGSGSGSNPSGGTERSRTQATTPGEANNELTSWGMTNLWADEGDDRPPPTLFQELSMQLEDLPAQDRDVAAILEEATQGEWAWSNVAPDADHRVEYGDGSTILTGGINLEQGIHFTSDVYTTETQDGGPRALPTSKRTLILNRWVSAGGSPKDLRLLVDGMIKNPDVQKAIAAVFAAKGTPIAVGMPPDSTQVAVIRPSDPEWSKWTDNNPFAIGYDKMANEYPQMASTPAWAVLVVNEFGEYSTVVYMEPITPL